MKRLYLQERFFSQPHIYEGMDIQQIELRPDFWISLLKNASSKNAAISYNKTSALIDFGFILSGKISHRLNHGELSESIEAYSGFSGIGFFPGQKGVAEISSHKPVHILHIHVSPKRLYEMVHDDLQAMPHIFQKIVTGNFNESYWFKSSMPLSAWAIAFELFNDGSKGLPKKLFLESKALELIAIQLGYFMDKYASDQNGKTFSLSEKERIHAARKLLVQDLTAPPSIRELEQRFSLSHNKLQAGFKSLFGNSVYGYLREYKMQQAHVLLEDAEMNVSKVAWSVGYDNISQFTKAYKKQFGMLPSKYRQDVLSSKY